MRRRVCRAISAVSVFSPFDSPSAAGDWQNGLHRDANHLRLRSLERRVASIEIADECLRARTARNVRIDVINCPALRDAVRRHQAEIFDPVQYAGALQPVVIHGGLLGDARGERAPEVVHEHHERHDA